MSIGIFWVHTASVETFSGRGAYGPTYATSDVVACFLDDSEHLVRDARGEEVISHTVLYAAMGDASKFTPESRVMVGDRASTVIVVNPNDSGALPLPAHVEVHLT